MPLQNLPRLLFTPGDILILPTAWSPALPVLHQQMRRTDLTRRRLGGEVLSNVFPQLFCIRAGRWLPFRLLGRGIEEVGKILRVGPADFPARGEASGGLGEHESVSLEGFDGVEGHFGESSPL